MTDPTEALTIPIEESEQQSEALATPVEQPPLEEYTEAPEDTAARIYRMLLPQFDRTIGALSKKGLVRTLTALVKVPLVDVYFKMDKVENEFCTLTSRLLQCKSVLETAVMMQIMEEAQKEENKKEEEK